MSRLVKDTFFLTLLISFAQLLGFLINVLSASLFGAGNEMDAFVVAQTIPVYIITVLTVGVGYTLVPMFIEKKEVSEKEAWSTSNSVLSILIVIIILITSTGLIFLRPIVGVFFSSLSKPVFELSIKLSYIVWPATIFTGLVTLIGFIYQAYERYIYNAFIQVVYFLLQFIFIYFGSSHFGIYVLAIGLLISSTIQFLLLLRIVYKKYAFQIRWTAEVKRIIKLQIPIIVASIFGQLPRIIDRSIASKLVVGTVAYVAYADKIKGLIGVVIGSGLAITFFPLLIQNLVKNDLIVFRKNISLGMKITLLLVCPIVCFGSFYALPLISLIFERGEFSRVDSIAIASVLPFFLVSLIGGTLGNVSSRAIYAMKKSNIVASIDIGSTLLYLIYAPLLTQSYGLLGIGVSIVILWNGGFIIQCAYIWFNLKKPVFTRFARVSFLILCSAFVSALFSYAIFVRFSNQGLISFILTGMLGMTVYGAVLYWIRIDEFRMAVIFVKNKFMKTKNA